MKAISIAYHDAVVAGEFGDSGFPGHSANSYKLDIADLKQHLAGIAKSGRSSLVSTLTSEPVEDREAVPVFLTFDDGGLSAIAHIADALERENCYGHFFIATDYIGSPAFMSALQIRTLSDRGHMIGSHSCSHPPNITKLPGEDILREWAVSVDVLSEIIGEQVSCASVPRGYNSQNVIEAAAKAGIRTLFTSEPTKRIAKYGECSVLGRYAIRRGDSVRKAVALTSVGPSAAQLNQSAYWSLKKLVKRNAGTMYERVRQWKLRNNATRGRPRAD